MLVALEHGILKYNSKGDNKIKNINNSACVLKTVVVVLWML